LSQYCIGDDIDDNNSDCWLCLLLSSS